MNFFRHLLWSFISPVAHTEAASQAASQLARHKHEQDRQRMLLVARSIRAAKGLPPTEALNG